MKFFIMLIFISSYILANYNYTGKNSGKIDMHGGKKSPLVGKSNFKDATLIKPIIDIKKPKKPQKPKELIEKKSEK